jgi:hypothetical protein
MPTIQTCDDLSVEKSFLSVDLSTTSVLYGEPWGQYASQLATYPLQLIEKTVHSCMLTTVAVFYEHARVDSFLS